MADEAEPGAAADDGGRKVFHASLALSPPPRLSWVVRPQKSKLRARSEELVCPRGWLIAASSEELVCPRALLRCGAGRGR